MNELEPNKSWRFTEKNLIYEDLKQQMTELDISPFLLYLIQISRLLDKLTK